MSESYLITDVPEFCSRLYSTLGEMQQMPNIEQYITRVQFDEIMKNHIVHSDDGDYIEEESIYEALHEAGDLASGALISKMAVKGLIDCAWDDEKQDMVFWATEKGKEMLKKEGEA